MLLPAQHAIPITSPPQMHFPLPTSVLDEHDTAERWRDLRSVLAAHPNVKLALSGHFHKVPQAVPSPC